MMTATTVRDGGKVRFRGLIWEDGDLKRYIGKQVLVRMDTSNCEASCIVFSMGNEFITNAQNKRRWSKIIRDARAHPMLDAFSGRTYFYNTPNDGPREIGVFHRLGAIWRVGWINDSGQFVQVSTPHLVGTSDPDQLQRMLDEYAAKRGLKEKEQS